MTTSFLENEYQRIAGELNALLRVRDGVDEGTRALLRAMGQPITETGRTVSVATAKKLVDEVVRQAQTELAAAGFEPDEGALRIQVAGNLLESDRRFSGEIVRAQPLSERIVSRVIVSRNAEINAFPGVPTREHKIRAVLNSMVSADLISREQADAAMFGSEDIELEQQAVDFRTRLDAAIPQIMERARSSLTARAGASEFTPVTGNLTAELSDIAREFPVSEFLAGDTPFPPFEGTAAELSQRATKRALLEKFLPPAPGKSPDIKAAVDAALRTNPAYASAVASPTLDKETKDALAEAKAALVEQLTNFAATADPALSDIEIAQGMMDFAMSQVTNPPDGGLAPALQNALSVIQASEAENASKVVQDILFQAGLRKEDVSKTDLLSLEQLAASEGRAAAEQLVSGNVDLLRERKSIEAAQSKSEAGNMATNALFARGVSESDIPDARYEQIRQMARKGQAALDRFLDRSDTLPVFLNEGRAERFAEGDEEAVTETLESLGIPTFAIPEVTTQITPFLEFQAKQSPGTFDPQRAAGRLLGLPEFRSPEPQRVAAQDPLLEETFGGTGLDIRGLPRFPEPEIQPPPLVRSFEDARTRELREIGVFPSGTLSPFLFTAADTARRFGGVSEDDFGFAASEIAAGRPVPTGFRPAVPGLPAEANAALEAQGLPPFPTFANAPVTRLTPLMSFPETNLELLESTARLSEGDTDFQRFLLDRAESVVPEFETFAQTETERRRQQARDRAIAFQKAGFLSPTESARFIGQQESQLEPVSFDSFFESRIPTFRQEFEALPETIELRQAEQESERAQLEADRRRRLRTGRTITTRARR